MCVWDRPTARALYQAYRRVGARFFRKGLTGNRERWPWCIPHKYMKLLNDLKLTTTLPVINFAYYSLQPVCRRSWIPSPPSKIPIFFCPKLLPHQILYNHKSHFITEFKIIIFVNSLSPDFIKIVYLEKQANHSWIKQQCSPRWAWLEQYNTCLGQGVSLAMDMYASQGRIYFININLRLTKWKQLNFLFLLLYDDEMA